LKHRNAGNVRVLIAVDNPIVRSGVHNALRDAGYLSVIMITGPDQIDIIEREIFDLIILSAFMGDRPFMPVITSMRDCKTNHHAFPIVILLMPEAGHGTISEAISSGADDVLLMPISTGQLIRRTNALTLQRKQFVLSRDYTGPDRRTDVRPGFSQVQVMDPPNPLKSKLDGHSDAEIKRQIDAASKKMNQVKMEAYGQQIDWIIRAIGEMFRTGSLDSANLEGYAVSLKRMASDLPSRLGNKMTKRIAALLNDVIGSADHIARDGLSLKPDDLALISLACGALTKELGKLRDVSDGKNVA